MSSQQTQAFSFEDKGVFHYAVFALGVGIPLLMAGVSILCIRTPMQRRKWLWLIFILLGCTQFTFDWNDGSYAFHPVAIVLFGANAVKMEPVGPCLVNLGIPVGAMIFLARRRRLVRPRPPGEA